MTFDEWWRGPREVGPEGPEVRRIAESAWYTGIGAFCFEMHAPLRPKAGETWAIGGDAYRILCSPIHSDVLGRKIVEHGYSIRSTTDVILDMRLPDWKRIDG